MSLTAVRKMLRVYQPSLEVAFIATQLGFEDEADAAFFLTDHGVVLEGTSASNEAMITGEATPIPKVVGDTVLGGALTTMGAGVPLLFSVVMFFNTQGHFLFSPPLNQFAQIAEQFPLSLRR